MYNRAFLVEFLIRSIKIFGYKSSKYEAFKVKNKYTIIISYFNVIVVGRKQFFHTGDDFKLTIISVCHVSITILQPNGFLACLVT